MRGMERWSDAVAALSRADPAMAAFVAQVGPCRLARRRHPGGAFAALARSILYQQLATGAAAAIHGRFAALYDGRPTPAAVLATPEADLRAMGLSAAKAASVKDLAAKVLDGTVRLHGITRLDDDEIVERLCAVRGIGPWTAHMFLIFQLNRPDVWPVGDYGVRAGYARITGLPTQPSPGELAPAGERFRPWRTVAAWYCWRALDAGVSPTPAGW
jgi:DNA-3-methyladenine glycosylase II